MNQPELEGTQYRLLQQLAPSEIPHGTNADDFVAELEYLIPYGGIVVDFGCGACEVAAELGPNFEYVGIDINPQVAAHLGTYSVNGKRITVVEGDVRKFWNPNLGALNYPMVEGCAGVLALGLMPSILFDEDVYRVFQSAEVYLEPGGRLIVADVLHASDANPALEKYFDGRLLLENYRKNWLSRYEINRRVRPDLPDGAFGVARESLIEKDRIDWLRDPDTVAWFLKSEIRLERFARHHRLGNLVDAASRAGLALEEVGYDVWRSRHDQPLSGVKLMFVKAARAVKYNPWYQGMDGEEIELARIVRRAMARSGSPFENAGKEHEFRSELEHKLPGILASDIPGD